MSKSRIAVILGAGPNVGAPTITAFRRKGFLVAYSSRSVDTKKQNDDQEGLMPLKCDFARPNDVENIFKAVRSAWGEPSVVIYNAYSHGVIPKEATDSLSLPTDAFEHDLSVNTTSAFVAAREATASFKKLPPGPKTFLYTGNGFVKGPFPRFLTLGLGKTASAHMIQLADQVFQEQDMRFHFVDERHADGKPMWEGVNGQAHADFFFNLAERAAGSNVPWYATFVKDKGYTEFPDKLML